MQELVRFSLLFSSWQCVNIVGLSLGIFDYNPETRFSLRRLVGMFCLGLANLAIWLISALGIVTI